MHCARLRFRSLALLMFGALILGWIWLAGAAQTRTASVADGAPADEFDGPTTPEGTLRQPVALALVDNGKLLLVANHKSGSLSIIDLSSRQVKGETRIGRQISDLAVGPGGRCLLATDEAADELIVLNRDGGTTSSSCRLKVGRSPVSVRLALDGSRAYVASLWSRQISVIDVTLEEAKSPRLTLRTTIDLPFPPRDQVLVEDGKQLLVADAFGGKLAVVDAAGLRVQRIHWLPAHNIRGLAVLAATTPHPRPVSPAGREGKSLLLVHQMLSGLATASRDDVHWGNLITNNLRMLPLADVVSKQGDVLRHSLVHYFGDVGRAAGDPAGIAVTTEGKVVVSFGGVGEVAVGPGPDGTWHRIKAGRRPTAVISSPDGRHAYIADTFGDAILVVDIAGKKLECQIPLGPEPALTASERGERLFYDARLSHDGWFSCHSCHSDGHTTGLLNDNLTDGSFGTPKRILSLLGVGDTGPWAWNGSMRTLESQIEKSIQSTMQGGKPSPEQVSDLAAYLKTLPPPPALVTKDIPAAKRGRHVFSSHGCTACHVPPNYTSEKTYDVGLQDEAGNIAFNPPSLRGVGQGGPYFHDGRAPTLEDVVSKFRHGLKTQLAANEREDLLHFLRSL